jgi:GTPase SAR1 family protein
MSRVDLKVVLLGSEYVGKTSLLERYVYDRFRGNLPYQNVSNSNLMINITYLRILLIYLDVLTQ